MGQGIIEIEHKTEPNTTDCFSDDGFLPVLRVQLLRERNDPLERRDEISDPFDAANVFRRYLQDEDREHFVALMLDSKSRMIGIHTVSVGNLNSAIVSPREVFKAAILANACSIIVAHNHPSGDPEPSPEDIQVTKTLKQAGELLGIELLDHVIIGEGESSVSMRRQRLF